MKKKSVVEITTLVLLTGLVACGSKNTGSGGPAAAEEISGDTKDKTNKIEFPRTFSGLFEVIDSRTLERRSTSGYEMSQETSLLGCLESKDGKDFTFILKNDDDYPDDLKIKVRNAYIRESKTEYRNITDFTVDGYTRNKWYQFSAKDQEYQFGVCEGKMERVRNYLTGFFQCRRVIPLNKNDSVNFVLQFSCDIVKEN